MARDCISHPSNAAYRPKPQQDARGRFITGNIGGGRSKGARSKLGESFIEELYASWRAGGREAIDRVRDEDPVSFLKIIASVIPREAPTRPGDLAFLQDDDLTALHEALFNLLASLREITQWTPSIVGQPPSTNAAAVLKQQQENSTAT